MIKLKSLLTFTLVIGVIYFAPAQSKREKKWRQAIDALEKSEFVLRYDSIKTAIEAQVADFQLKSAGLYPEDEALVKKGYESSVAKFDRILDDLKHDFTNPDTREYIANNPDRFSRYLEGTLNDATQHYNNHCGQKMADLVELNNSTAFGLMEVGMLIALGKELWSLWENQSAKANKMSGEYFEREFVTQHRIKKWEDY